jgi:hypothetical protein
MMRIRDSGPRAAAGRVAVSALLVAATTAGPLAAQVGNQPSLSPFHDLTARQAFTFSAGRFGGNAGGAGVGWRPGAMAAVRLDTRIGGPVDFYVSIGFAGSSRYKINTEQDTLTRKTGPFKKTLFLTDIGLVLNLTGAKTWHGIAPYVGFGAGWVLPSAAETDTGGYNAGSNLTLVPSLGTRIFFTRSLAARIEVRDYIFRYEWPLRYFDPRDRNGLPITPAILPLGAKDKQLTHNIALTVGFVYGFNF